MTEWDCKAIRMRLFLFLPTFVTRRKSISKSFRIVSDYLVEHESLLVDTFFLFACFSFVFISTSLTWDGNFSSNIQARFGAVMFVFHNAVDIVVADVSHENSHIHKWIIQTWWNSSARAKLLHPSPNGGGVVKITSDYYFSSALSPSL